MLLLIYVLGLGVAAVAESCIKDGRLAGAGVLVLGTPLGAVASSDSGGLGGVGASSVVSDCLGGVDIVGDNGVLALVSLDGLAFRTFRVAMMFGFRERKDSIVLCDNRSFSKVISLSIRRSPSSSRSL